MTDYDASSIQVLEGLEAVRRRPGMYIGDVGAEGMHVLLFEVLSNALREQQEGHASWIRVQVDGHAVTVEDDGRGIPVELREREGKSVLELVMTTLLVGCRYHPNPGDYICAYHFCGGVGLAAVNALSAHLTAEVQREGRRYRQRYEKGKPVTALEEVGPTARSGTKISFVPDFSILEQNAWDLCKIRHRLRELSALVKGKIGFQREVFNSPEGLATLAGHLIPKMQRFHERPLSLYGEHQDIKVEAALQWTADRGQILKPFVNGVLVPQGPHLQGFHMGIAEGLRKAGARSALEGIRTNVLWELLSKGLVAVLSIGVKEPHFGDQARTFLKNEDAKPAVAWVIGEELGRALVEHPVLYDRLLMRIY